MLNKTALLNVLAMASTTTIAAFLGSSSASAAGLTYDWSFTTDSSSTGGAGQVISGTISGLVEGSNNGSGLTITVTSTPGSQLLGNYSNFDGTQNGGDAFTVTGGAVTFADAEYDDGNNNILYFGGYGGYDPELANYNTFDPIWQNGSGGQTTFTPVITAVPEPSSLGEVLGMGVFLGVGALSSKLQKKPESQTASDSLPGNDGAQ